MQGNKTIHEILNDLKKYTDRMVMQPDEYTFHRRFVSALQELLRQEVLQQGLNPEKSTISQLYELVNAIEETTRYNQGTRRTEGIGTIPSMTQQSVVLKPLALNQSVRKPMPVIRPASQPTQHSCPVNVAWHEHRTAPAVPTNKNTPYWSGSMSRPPVVTGDRPSTHNNIVCYECDQTGHIKPNCPKLKGSVRVAAICTEGVPDEGGNMEIEQEALMNIRGKNRMMNIILVKLSCKNSISEDN